MKETIDQNGAGAVKTAKFFTVRNMAFIAVMAALICVAAPWSVPMPGLVPVSLATFAVYRQEACSAGRRAPLQC